MLAKSETVPESSCSDLIGLKEHRVNTAAMSHVKVKLLAESVNIMQQIAIISRPRWFHMTLSGSTQVSEAVQDSYYKTVSGDLPARGQM